MIILTISRLLEVNISVTERTSSNHITTDAYREYGPSRGKLLEKHRLRDITMQVTHVKWGHGVIRSSRIHYNIIPSSCSCLSWKISLIFGISCSFNMACALPTTLSFVMQLITIFFHTLLTFRGFQLRFFDFFVYIFVIFIFFLVFFFIEELFHEWKWVVWPILFKRRHNLTSLLFQRKRRRK